MAKNLLGSLFGGGPKPAAAVPAGGGAPTASPRPAPRGQPIMPQKQGGGGLFPGMGAQQRYDMAMSLLQQSMGSANASGDPLLAFLSPIAGAAIGGGIESKFGKAKAEEQDALNETLLGSMAGNPQAQGYIDILNSDTAPDYAKSIAKDQLGRLMNPPKGRAPKPGFDDRPPSNSDALLTRLMWSASRPDSDGGEDISPKEQARIDAVRRARTRQSEATIDHLRSGDLGGDSDAGSVNANDPLGIR